eukprot:scaffold3811_cov116-Isochrysis_galbana.AAC.4
MGDPSRYPEIRLARHMYALQWLPRDIRDDSLIFFNSGSTTICPTSTRARSRSFKLEMLTFVGLLGLFTITSTCAALACAPNGFGPSMSLAFPLPRPLSIVAPCASTHSFPILKSIPPVPLQRRLRSSKCATPQWSVRAPPSFPIIYGTYDCWQNPQSTPPDQPIVMPVHPSHIPLAPMYPPDFDSPTSVIDTPTP